MTQKEKLYKEFIIKKNKYLSLVGEELLEASEEYFNSSKFSVAAKRKTKEELMDDIEYIDSLYERTLFDKRVKDYFLTEEGLTLEQKLTSEIADLDKKRKGLYVTTTKKIDSFIKSWLGEDWGAYYLGLYGMEVGLVEIYENGENYALTIPHFYFGHKFSLSYNYTKFGKETLSMNYGSMGSFDVFNDETRCKFLIGMGTFLNDKEKVSEMNKMIKSFCFEIYDLEEKISKLEQELLNPFRV